MKFLVTAESVEDAEELIGSLCEKAASSFSAGEISYEGIEEIEEEETEE